MNLMLTLDPQPVAVPITYTDQILLLGSCFSDHIGAKLEEARFKVCYNPTGIVFDPLSAARHLSDMVGGKQYTPTDLFALNELWNSWLHHSDFSATTPEEACRKINEAIHTGNETIKSASYLFITLGTAYSYLHIENQIPVANNHKAPRSLFEKRLLDIDTMVEALRKAIREIREMNPTIQIVFTVSPVKHIRDGIVENNRSKSRLIEVAHRMSELETGCNYFPAYELVTDVLRDYRFYAPDMAHPNMQAIGFVFDHFCQTYFTQQTRQYYAEVMEIVSAKHHRPLHPQTASHKQFLKNFSVKVEAIKTKLPGLDWSAEERYFNKVSV